MEVVMSKNEAILALNNLDEWAAPEKVYRPLPYNIKTIYTENFHFHIFYFIAHLFYFIAPESKNIFSLYETFGLFLAVSDKFEQLKKLSYCKFSVIFQYFSFTQCK